MDNDVKTGILDGFATVEAFARETHRTARTIRRYCNQPNGLPFLKLGPTRLIPVAAAQAWLQRKIIEPNPTASPVRHVRRRRRRPSAESGT